MKNKRIDNVLTFIQVLMLFFFMFSTVIKFIEPLFEPMYHILGMILFTLLLLDRKLRNLTKYNKIVYALAILYFAFGLIYG